MPHLFFAAGDEESTADTQSSGYPGVAGQNMWGKTWNKVGGWLKKEDEENEPPAVLEELEHLDEKEQEKLRIPEKSLKEVKPGLPRPLTFARQNSERREKLCPHDPDPEERRACSSDRRAGTAYPRKASPSRIPVPLPLLPTSYSPDGRSNLPEETRTQLQSGPEGQGQTEQDNPESNPFHPMSHHGVGRDQDHLSEALDDLQIQAELEAKWILNLSMHFRDNSDREKFFITYAEEPNKWRRVTISCDYRNVPADSLEADIKSLHYQRDKSARIYESIRDSLADIQFYPTVTNLKLQTSDGRLHVHVTEDVNEKIPYPPVSLLRHLKYPRFRESAIEFDSHLSGFVYKIKTSGNVYIKKEIPGPEAVEEFLYEVNALSNLRGTSNVVQFEGIVVDDSEQLIKGLLIGFCEQGALVDVIYDYKNSEWLPWSRREMWAKQIIRGLSEIHEAGFVQGDFTLSNIVIEKDDIARIIDINRRGCPVGWEPPELSELIQSGQRISIYIGVKSDLFQLGMVLWALAEQQDEPERQERPLRLNKSSDIPEYYRQVVESCLSTDPSRRQSAKDLYAMFPHLENSQPELERDSTICLSPRRSEKEYIDPATAVDLEDINHLKASVGESHDSQFSATTFADGATSTEYLFVSSGSELVGHRGRSPAPSGDWAEQDAASSSQETHVIQTNSTPRCPDSPTQSSHVSEPEHTEEAIDHPGPTTPTLADPSTSLVQTDGAVPNPTLVSRQDSEQTILPTAGDVVTQDQQRPTQPFEHESLAFRTRTFGPPLHQDSGFDELPVLEVALKPVTNEESTLASQPETDPPP